MICAKSVSKRAPLYCMSDDIRPIRLAKSEFIEEISEWAGAASYLAGHRTVSNNLFM